VEIFDPASDPRSVDELFFAALTETDEELAWQPVAALHYRGTREVLKRAYSLCVSQCSFERQLGANVLGQLGVPERTFPRECRTILLRMLKGEHNSEVLQAVLIALYHNEWAEVVPHALPFADHPNADVRHAAVLALNGHEEQAAIECLIRLSRDRDSDVRDWATFGLGSQCDLDTPEIRDALAARLDDADDDTRHEAIVGLARRQDRRAIAAIHREIAADSAGSLVFEAAELLGLPDLAV
jgi:HEAT repeat protein